MPFLATEGSRVLEKKANETQVSKTVFSRRLCKGKFQTFSSKSGRGRLLEVVAYKRFQISRFDLERFGILENWSVVATGGSTFP